MSEAEHRPSPLRVLMVEDSREDAELIAFELAEAGLDPRWERVESLAELEAALDQRAWDVVLCDHVVPGFGSTQALSALAGSRLEVPAIVVSGRIGEEAVAAALRAGAVDYVSKDRLAQLAPAIRRALVVAEASRRQHAAEQALREASALHAAVLETTQNAYVAIDDQGVITDWNRAAELTFGWSKAQAIGREMVELIIPVQHRAAHRADFRRYLERGESRVLGRRLEVSAVRADGSEFPIEMTLSAARRGGRHSFHAFIADIGERLAREHEARWLATIVQQSVDAIIAKTPDGIITEWNRGAERLYGYSAEDAVGRPISMLIPPERRGEENELLRRALAGEPAEHETTRVRADGSTVEVSITISPIRDATGKVVAISTIARDITETKRLHRQLQAIFDNVPAPLVTRGPDGRYRHANTYVTRSLGIPLEQLIGSHPEEHYPPAAAAEIRAQDERLIRTRAAFSHEMTVYHGDGSVHDYHVVTYPVLDADGELSAFGSFSIDITERKRAEARLREAEERFRGLLESAPDAIVIAGEQGEIALVNAQTERLFGYSREELIGQPVELLIPERLGQRHAWHRSGFAAAPSVRQMGAGLELAARRKDGSEFPVEISLSPLQTDSGMVVSASVRDITARKRAESALRLAEERFRRAFGEAPIGMALISPDGRIEQANTALGVICERTRGELEGLALRELVHPADREQTQTMLRALVSGDLERFATELRFMPAGGAAVEVAVHSALLEDEAGRPAGVLCQFQDVTERKRFEQQLQFMADHDPLTGLMNRRKFEQELDKHVAHVKRYGAEGALIVLDIDHFKQVNDTLGHNAGDELIVSVAAVLRERLRESDILARLGGDEFAVLLPKADEAGAAQVARALVLAVRMSSALLNGERKKVTISVGVSMFERDNHAGGEQLCGETVLIEADLAMYDAKEAGRDGYAFYAASPHRVSRTEARLTWANRIEHALEHDRFVLLAQPILDLRAGRVTQHELLVRMLDERDELIPPASFLYIAERFGLVARLDEWVASRAIELLDRHPDTQLSVNISGRSLGDQPLLETIQQRLRSIRIDPARLIFEVTETAAVANITQAQTFAQHLRDLGCRFALDDFGAGFGSFYYLKHLPFDYVKIDGEFVQHVATGRIDQLVIEAVVGIAQGLGKETIAEFVTDEKTQRIVQRLGVDHAQGYHIGKPALATQLLDTSVRVR
jgi:diguanylate cyclase (GGDEF)-like protein/PAS domain S-box-containing protein